LPCDLSHFTIQSFQGKVLSTNRQRDTANQNRGTDIMLRRHWLDYDSVALAALIFGLGIVELLALSI